MYFNLFIYCIYPKLIRSFIFLVQHFHHFVTVLPLQLNSEHEGNFTLKTL